MASLKDLFMEIEDDEDSNDDSAIEVYADSVKQALELSSEDLGIDITMLDYEILEKGSKGFFGMGRQPYRVLIRPIKESMEHDDLDAIEKKLSGENLPGITAIEKKDIDGSFKVRVAKTGIWLTVTPVKGKGKKVDLMDVNNKIYTLKIDNVDTVKIDKEVNKPSGERVKIGEWKPNPEYDGSMTVEITEDEMKAFIHFSPPRFSGRHMEFDEVVDALKRAGVATGIDEDRIKEYLDNMNYNQPLDAAEGAKPRNGKDGYIDYKVKVDNTGVSFEEDESGKVDFRNLEVLENVVIGQLLASQVPSEEGIPGRTVTNQILPAKSGKDIKIQFGKGTILSEDGTELTAEINGQVVFKANKISIEPVYVVKGDVSLQTGNIVFLGSVIVSGNVQDNFVVKAAGNIEVRGTVQKAFLEAEGDIVIYQGIMGRNEAKIESTGGSIYAKFIQSANVIAEKTVIVPEGIMHARVDAGEGIFSQGRRARIVGGLIRAGNEVNARFLGADVSTKTEIRVGINPKVLQQITDLNDMKEKIEEEVNKNKLDLKTLETQKKSTGKLSGEKAKMLEDLNARNDKLTGQLEDVVTEFEELNSYVEMLEHQGKICAEKTAFGGVDIYIKDQKFLLKDPYNSVKFSMEGGEIRISEYEAPELVEGQRLKRAR